MGQVLWHVTMSLDGFIAGPRDDMTWLADYLGPNPTADQVLPRVGALLLGDRTYQVAKTEQGRPYGGAWTGPQFVLSHHPPKDPPAGFTFLSGDIEEAVATAKAAAVAAWPEGKLCNVLSKLIVGNQPRKVSRAKAAAMKGTARPRE